MFNIFLKIWKHFEIVLKKFDKILRKFEKFILKLKNFYKNLEQLCKYEYTAVLIKVLVCSQSVTNIEISLRNFCKIWQTLNKILKNYSKEYRHVRVSLVSLYAYIFHL